MRAGRRDSLYDSNRDQFAAAISPKRGLLNAYTPTFTLCSTHHVHAHAACTRTISRPRCVRGWSRSKIDSVARIRPLQRCQLARCPRRERKGGGRTFVHRVFGRICHSRDEKARTYRERRDRGSKITN